MQVKHAHLSGILSTFLPDPQGSGYMMAFPMNDDNLAEESAQEAVKILAESLANNDDDDDDDDDEDEVADQKKDDDVVEAAEKKEDQTEQPEPMGILQAELAAEDEAAKPSLPQRPFFKRPKIEELRKILGFPPPEGPAKAKPIPQEKPKVFQNVFNKPKPKIEQSPLGGLQFNLRREDRMRPFGFPMLPLKRDDSFRPFGIPDLVQAASSMLRRAIIDDNNENDINDISKDDKEEDEPQINENEPEDNEEEDEDESVMIVPLPDPKEVTIERPPLFRRFPIPLPFSVPRPAPQQRPRLPFPPLTPVAFFLPIAQQIMQNIRHAQPRSSPPMVPLNPVHHVQPQIQNLIPLQSQIPFIHVQHPMQQQFIPIHQPMMPLHQPVQQVFPFFPVPQAAIHIPVLTPLPPNIQRPILRQMPQRMPVHPHQQPPQMHRRMPFPSPMARMANPQPHVPVQPRMVNPVLRRPLQPTANRPIHQVVRPPMPPVHPVLFMMAPVPVPSMHVPMTHPQQMPIFPRQQHIPFIPQPMPAMSQPRHIIQPFQVPEEERVIFVRPDQDDQDDDQEVLILVPSDEVEVAQRPPFLPPQLSRQMPTPVVNPLQRIKLLRDLLLARQANRQPMNPEARASKVVELVQQQLRIFPAHHPQVQFVPQIQRQEASELHPVYVPYPGPQ